jgi:hypothetical protein
MLFISPIFDSLQFELLITKSSRNRRQIVHKCLYLCLSNSVAFFFMACFQIHFQEHGRVFESSGVCFQFLGHLDHRVIMFANVIINSCDYNFYSFSQIFF